MSETREFSTATIASISTGTLLCPFSEMHEAAEFLMGHPIWTHHFASKELWRDMQRAVLVQCPGMPTTAEGITPENFKEKLTQIEAAVGPVQTIRKGSGVTAMLPTDGIPDHVKVITVEVPKA